LTLPAARRKVDVPLLKKNGGQLHSCVSFSRTRIRIHPDCASGSHRKFPGTEIETK